MKMKKFISIIALICLVATTSCGVGSSDDDSLNDDGRGVGRSDVIEAGGDTEPPSTAGNDELPQVSEPETQPIAETNKRLKFIAAGDNIIHESVYTDAKKRSSDGNSFNFRPMYDGIAAFVADADIAFINQETPTAGESYGYHGYPNFNSPQEAGHTLVDLGFDIVNIATNHMLDMKTNGLRDFIKFWKSLDNVLMIGGYEDYADYDNVRIYETDGIKIAFLSYTYDTNGMALDPSSALIVPLFDEAVIRRQVQLARDAADLVFVSAHWGIENDFVPSDTQKKYAKIFADAGVDAVIGHHPHVVQPVEWMEGSGGNRMLLIYSLGNLISTMNYGQNMIGGIASFDIVIEDGNIPYIDAPVYIPTVTHYSLERDGLQVYLLEDYTPELAAKHGCTLYTPNFSIDYMKNIIKTGIKSEFLPDFLK